MPAGEIPPLFTPTKPGFFETKIAGATGGMLAKGLSSMLMGTIAGIVMWGFNYLVRRYPAEAINISAKVMNEYMTASQGWVNFATAYMKQMTGKEISDKVIKECIGGDINITGKAMASEIGKEFLAPMLNMIMPRTVDFDEMREKRGGVLELEHTGDRILDPVDGLIGAENFLGVNLQFQLQAWMLHFIGDTVSMGSLKSLKDLPNAISWSYGIGWLSWLVMGTPFRLTIADPLTQLLNMLYRPTQLTVAQAIDAWNSGYITGDQLYKLTAEAGYQDNIAAILINQGTTRIPTGTLHDGYLLGRFDWPTVAGELQRTGYNAERIAWLKTVWELERHDDLLKKWATECIDSFEKGFIDEGELRAALSAAGWEDVETGNTVNLQVNISTQKRMKQSQFTKAEIRDMWAQGIITDDVADAYLQRIGMTDTNIAILKDFWGGGLIERDVMNLYLKLKIDPKKAKDYLRRLGIPALDADTLMTLWDAKLAQMGLPRQHWLNKYELRTLGEVLLKSWPDVRIGLENIGYSEDDAENLVAVWKGEKRTETQKLQDRIDELLTPEPPTLSRTEVKQLFDKGLMNLQAVYKSLRDKGYSYEDATLLTQLYTDTTEAQIKGIAPYTPPAVTARDLTVTEIKQLYEAGAPGFDTLGTLGRMKGIGYSEADATLLIALWLPWYPPEEGA